MDVLFLVTSSWVSRLENLGACCLLWTWKPFLRLPIQNRARILCHPSLPWWLEISDVGHLSSRSVTMCCAGRFDDIRCRRPLSDTVGTCFDCFCWSYFSDPFVLGFCLAKCMQTHQKCPLIPNPLKITPRPLGAECSQRSQSRYAMDSATRQYQSTDEDQETKGEAGAELAREVRRTFAGHSSWASHGMLDTEAHEPFEHGTPFLGR